MEIQANRIGTAPSLSALSPGQMPLPLPERVRPGPDASEGSVLPSLPERAGVADQERERQARLEAAHRDRPPITYEERLKQLLSVDEMRRLLYLYSPFTRVLLNEEKGRAVDRTA